MRKLPQAEDTATALIFHLSLSSFFVTINERWCYSSYNCSMFRGNYCCLFIFWKQKHVLFEVTFDEIHFYCQDNSITFYCLFRLWNAGCFLDNTVLVKRNSHEGLVSSISGQERLQGGAYNIRGWQDFCALVVFSL